MNNTVLKRIFAGMMLTTFAMTNTLAYADVIRYDDSEPVKLSADVSITKINKPISLSLRDSDAKQVLRMFADKAGMNIIFDKDVSGTVTMDLVNVPLNSAFNMVLGVTGLNYVVEGNTLVISASGTQSNMAQQEINIVPVKYIDASAMAEFLNKNIFTMKKPGLTNADIVTTNPLTNELLIFGTQNDVKMAKKVVDKFDKKPLTTNIKVNHTTPEQMANLICDTLIPATSSSKGGSTGGAAGIMTGGAAGIVTGGASSSSRSSSSSSSSSDGLELGGGEVACSVETSNSGTFTPIPLQSLTVSYFTQLGMVGIMGGSPQQVEMIKEFVQQNDIKQPQAYLEVSIIELNEDGMKDITNTWSFNSEHFSISSSGGNISTDLHLMGGFPKGEHSGPPSLVWSINYALSSGKGRVIANPKILITNGQESTIELTEDYVKSTTTQFSQTTMSSQPITNKTYDIADDNGIEVSITPFISPDGYVTMDITPEYATIASQVTKPAIDPETGETYQDIQATLLNHRNLDLKNVRIKDGDTLVIGGMIKESETKVISKIPFLGDIPGLGTFFRSSTNHKTKNEMIIMITPKIIKEIDEVTTQNTL